jgi:NADPH2 dehydrogenase
MMASSSKLFKPMRIGRFEVSNRIVLAPLTRFRADDSHVPLPFVADYYAQRASYPGTLLVTEATFISPEGGGYSNVPGIYNTAQIKAWKKVTDAVHAKKSFIALQLWAVGRTATLKVLKEELGENAKVVAPSDIPMAGGSVPTPLTEEEIWEYIGYYKQAAKNAIEAGFDMIELHGANGYIIDQFTQDVSNQRTDAWGGSVEKRARFAVEVTKAVVEAVGADRTGIRISPYSTFKSMQMKNPEPQFAYLAEELKKLDIAYLHIIESRVVEPDPENRDVGNVDFLLDIWGSTSPVLLASGYSPNGAYKAVDQKHKGQDIAIVFGRYFISNPDLVFRIRENLSLTPYDRSTFYNRKEQRGYITWEFSKEWEAQGQKILTLI